VPFLAHNDYKARSYPVWNLLIDLHAQGKLTPRGKWGTQTLQGSIISTRNLTTDRSV